MRGSGREGREHVHEPHEQVNSSNCSPRETSSIWHSDSNRFLLPLFSSCDTKINGKDFQLILVEIVKPDTDLQNLNEFLKKTYLDKDNIEVVFKLFLENCKEYSSQPKKNPGMLVKLNKALLLVLHLENQIKRESGVLVQLIMDNFDLMLDILQCQEPHSTVCGGGREQRVLGLFRVEILRLVHHCLIIDHKNFNLMASMSKLGEILMGLVDRFHQNDRFVLGLFDTIELVLGTNHKPLIESLLGSNRVTHILNRMIQNPQSNRFILLRLLKLVDLQFWPKCFAILEREATKEEQEERDKMVTQNATQLVRKAFLEELQANELFEVVQIKAYPWLKTDIKTYFDLEQELNDRKNLKMSGSSIFSNNMLDDVEIGNLHKMSSSVDSDDEEELANMADRDDNDEERNSYGGIVRRRKISEDNIKVGHGRGRGVFGADYM